MPKKADAEMTVGSLHQRRGEGRGALACAVLWCCFDLYLERQVAVYFYYFRLDVL